MHPGQVDPYTNQNYPDILDGIWHQFNARLNPYWTDAEAQAAGWGILGGGSASWASVLANAEQFALQGNGTSASDNRFGIDNAAIGSWPIPEPATLFVLGLSTLAGLIRRR